MDMDAMRENYREPARKAVLSDIMLENVANAEKLTATQPELDFEIEIMAQMYRTPAKQIQKYLSDNGQLVNVANNIRRRKAMKFIFDNMAGAKVETPTEETTETKETEQTTENKENWNFLRA